MWEEWRTTVWQRSLETVVHRECAVEAGRRNAGKKFSSKPLRLNLWKNRRLPIEEEEKKKKKKNISFYCHGDIIHCRGMHGCKMHINENFAV